jgi:hypothetical protein
MITSAYSTGTVSAEATRVLAATSCVKLPAKPVWSGTRLTALRGWRLGFRTSIMTKLAGSHTRSLMGLTLSRKPTTT